MAGRETQAILAGQLLALRGPAGIQPALRKDRICLRLTAGGKGRGGYCISPCSASPLCRAQYPHPLFFFPPPPPFFFFSFSSPNSTCTQWRLPIRSSRGCHAPYLSGRLRRLRSEERCRRGNPRPSVRPSLPGAGRAAGRLLGGGGAAPLCGQRPLQLGGEPPRPGASIHGLRQRARGHLAPLRLLPSASPTTRCVYFSPRPLPANPPSAEPQQPGWPPSHH